MNHLDLNGEWNFRAVAKYGPPPATCRRVLDWAVGTVPGTVHTDLMANGIIPDPSYRMNELDVRWVDALQWLYRKEFTVPAELLSERQVMLVAKGLDTFATVSLNGKRLGNTANMFIGHSFDVRRVLKPGRNVMEILFDSPTYRTKALERKHGQLQVALESHRVYSRKAQYSFGWDWGPTLTTSGIWRDIFIEGFSDGKVRDPWVNVMSVDTKRAVLQVHARIEAVARKGMKLHVTINNEHTRVERQVAVSGREVRMSMAIPQPNLWWPNGYGEQPLYTATFTLRHDGSEVHSVSVSFGIRTIRLVQEKDEQGKTFIFEVNGVKIFCKGANWIPCDNFIPRIPDSTYERLLTHARDAHMNMIRVWGGGFYEQDHFYNLCDRLGLMVWQDFMFACGEYPKQGWFLSLVKHEAEQVVKRLRNHPSIVLWCGNNECEWIYCTENPGKKPDDMSGARIFSELLPSVVQQHDGSRPYWRSSPFGDGCPNSESNGNHHQWTVWSAWKDYKEYHQDAARFVTEFGFQGPAHVKTFEAVTVPEDRNPQSPVMEHHNKQIEGTERLFRFQSAHYTVGRTFEDFIFKGQLLQAEALKYAVEHWRRRKFGTAGALFWQLNDCWPVSSWSVIDSALRPKAAWFHAKRFFAPLLVSLKKEGNILEVWGTNDLLDSVTGTLELTLLSFTGERVWHKETEVRLARNSSRVVHRIPMNDVPQIDPTVMYFRARLAAGEVRLSENRLFMVEPKHLRLPKANITACIKKEGAEALITLSANAFVNALCLESEDAVFDDNYFDMDAGETKSVAIQSTRPDRLPPEGITVRWLESDPRFVKLQHPQ
ncbi:MAG: glycoside hydrolase family 2 protein [Bacteroidota bacterium]